MNDLTWHRRLAIVLFIGWVIFFGMISSESHSFNWSLFIFGGLGVPAFLFALVWTVIGFCETRKKQLSILKPDQSRKRVGYPNASVEQGSQKCKVKYPIWSRFLARIFDYYIYTVVIAFSTGILFPSAAKDIKESTLSILLFIVGVLSLAVTTALTGTSVGKMLFGLKTLGKDGGKLTSVQIFKRELLVWYKGCGLGIPLVSLFTLSRAHANLEEYGETAWDKALSSEVKQRPLGKFRLSFSILIVLSFICSFNAYDKYLTEQELKAASIQIWENPITKREVKLPKGWTVLENLEDSSLVVSSFGNIGSGHARLLNEDLKSEISLNKYAQALLLSKKISMEGDYIFSNITDYTINEEALRSFSIRGPSLEGYIVKFHIWQDSKKPTVFWHALFTQKNERYMASDPFGSLLGSFIDSSIGNR